LPSKFASIHLHSLPPSPTLGHYDWLGLAHHAIRNLTAPNLCGRSTCNWLGTLAFGCYYSYLSYSAFDFGMCLTPGPLCWLQFQFSSSHFLGTFQTNNCVVFGQDGVQHQSRIERRVAIRLVCWRTKSNPSGLAHWPHHRLQLSEGRETIIWSELRYHLCRRIYCPWVSL
jgi:hypothetical protein